MAENSDSNKTNDNSKIIIEGVTEQGEKFRPSDWAQRLSGSLSTLEDKRLHYDPRLMPMRNEDGNSCVLLDPKLKESNPSLYNSILEFAKINNLRICGQNDPEEDSD